jgi:serine/threonine-protein kinase
MTRGAKFEHFELDLCKRELRKQGIRLRLPDQSFEILAMLIERGGEIVSRDEIRERLWPNGTIVEFEHSVNSAVKRLRDALGDTRSPPHFIETLPRKGYRFLVPLEIPRPEPNGTRYRILREAGRGSMGVVYQAEDTTLGRQVALKFLNEEFANSPSALERLRREACTSASLNHPGICTLHGLEQHQGQPCLVMEFLEGTSLARLITAVGPLPAERALAIAMEVCAALAAAHAEGVVHRDIKPGNLFLTRSGTTKITDFGIALRGEECGSVTCGTPDYASPEQCRGEKVDGRSDIFSVGLVLYEMVTGGPFNHCGAPAARAYPVRLPKGLERIIERCVEPDPAHRFQTARELHDALRDLKEETGRRSRRWLWMAIAGCLILGIAGLGLLSNRGNLRWPVRSEIHSLAVLPLVNLSGDAAQEYLADGVTEALTSNLAELGMFRVTSRTSAMTYKGSRVPVAKIADRLNVDALIEGSVSRSGERIRVVAQLIDASRDVHLWSKTYERNFKDLHHLQSELAQAITREIQKVVKPRHGGVVERPLQPDAYEAYLKGMFHLNKLTPEGFDQGIWYLRQAIEKDPADPLAYAKLALGYALMAHDGSPEDFAQTKAAAKKALELDASVPEAYAALGMVDLYSEWNFARGASNLQRALELNPNLAEARRAYAWYLLLVGRGKEALTEMRSAIEREPLVPIFPADLAWQLFDLGDFDAALTEAHKSLELDPNFAQALAIAGWAFRAKGMEDEAVAAHRKAAADEEWKWPLARTYALMGRRDEARKIVALLVKNPRPLVRWGLASVYAALGDKENAFQCLEEAFQSRFSWMPWDHVRDLPTKGSQADLFGPLRDDPRFQRLRQRIGVQ